METVDAWTTQALVAVVDDLDQTRHALHELQQFGILPHELSLLGKGVTGSEQAAGVCVVDGSPSMLGGVGAVWSGLWGPALSHAFVWIRYVGLVAAVGPIVESLLDAIEDADEADPRNISAVGDALAAMGAPAASVLQHETDLLDGKILVIVQGRLEYLLQVQSLLLEIQVVETEFLVA